MMRFKCWWYGHKFFRVARSKQGMTLERYVECKHCAKVIIMIGLHPHYSFIYESIPAVFLPKIMYLERKLLHRKISKQRERFEIMSKLDYLNGECHDSTKHKPANP